ncbi:hypothetical protein IPL68_03960 [Candidatus Saccharibacteria bacterium]|nr:MAG: hypothetical protein IPL68_03960 [Candidatus Saccharibacteria bacterium]
MRTTLTLDDDVYLALKHRAVDAGVSMSRYLEDAITTQLFPDATSREEIERRMREPTVPYQEVIARLKVKGKLS